MSKKIELQQPDLSRFLRAPSRATTLVVPAPTIARGTPQPLPLVNRSGAVHALSAGGSTPAIEDSGERGGPETVYLSF